MTKMVKAIKIDLIQCCTSLNLMMQLFFYIHILLSSSSSIFKLNIIRSCFLSLYCWLLTIYRLIIPNIIKKIIFLLHSFVYKSSIHVSLSHSARTFFFTLYRLHFFYYFSHMHEKWVGRRNKNVFFHYTFLA